MTKRPGPVPHFCKAIYVFLYCTVSTFLANSCAARSPVTNRQLEGKWYINFAHIDIGQARTIIECNTRDSTFTAHSRKNADKDILGNWTSFLGRTFTKGLKNGSLLHIEKGIYAVRNDTLYLAGILVTPMGNFNLEGHVVNNQMYATLKNKSRGYVGSLSGDRHIPDLPLENYTQLFTDAVSLTETKIFNKEMLRSGEWNTFTKEMQERGPKLQDDLEMVFAFYYHATKLPFSHFSLMKPYSEQQQESVPPTPKKNLFLEEKSPNTAYLKITSFGGEAREVDNVFKIIAQKKYEHLIVDLRNNTGGTIEAGMAFATNVIDKETFGGVFLTQKWFDHHGKLPTPDAYKALPHFTEANYDLIIEGIHGTEGLCLKMIPKEKVYNGELYILTNSRTASTCEPIVYELKKQKRAVIIGETTAGAMLNGEFFELSEGFKMIIPTADHYTSDGHRIDQKGVEPDIKCKSEEAMDVAMKAIGN